MVAGLRPENFEDVAVVGDLKQERGVTFEAEIDIVESLGSDLFAYFHIESEGVQSDQLADLVGDRLDETGAANIREGEEQIVARLDPTSEVKRGERAELWADTAKLHLFDPESGEALGELTRCRIDPPMVWSSRQLTGAAAGEGRKSRGSGRAARPSAAGTLPE